MHFAFTRERDYLRAELFGRQSAEETAQFAEALVAEARRANATRILVWVRNSRPIFKVEQYKLSELLRQAVRNLRVALLADSDELRASHEYIEILARQQGVQVRSFRDEARALDWLAAQSQE